ncbi:MAG: PAS domain-containing protein, partial [Anaerolineae bacterium]|nr:PAS domain-containing protein [Anaerolineae bacterium]
PELVCLVESQGNVIRVNRTVEAWGLAQVLDVRGRDFHDLLHPGCTSPDCYLRTFLQTAYGEALRGRPSVLEARDPLLQRYLSICIRPVVDLHKDLASTSVIVVQDITERKQAEVALQRYAERLAVINEISQAILSARSSREIAQVALDHLKRLIPYQLGFIALAEQNGAVLSILSIMVPHPTSVLRPGYTFSPRVLRGIRSNQSPNVIRLTDVPGLSEAEREMMRVGARAYVTISLMAEGTFVGVFTLGTKDVKDLQQEYLDIAYEVASLLAVAIRHTQLYEELRHTNKELEAALRARDEMIQNVSHELCTPLTIIRGYTELMQEGGAGELTAAQKGMLATISTHSDRLLHMLNRLLTLQRLDSDVVEKVPFVPAAILRRIVRAWRATAERAGIELRLKISDELPYILANPDLFDQTMVNLLDNAIKFSPGGGTVTVRSWANNGSVFIAVSDQGIGIPAHALNHIFDRFYQVDGSMSRRFGGMGIGLALCKKIVQIHGGRIWASSPGEGKGSTFTIALPVAAPPEDDVE